MFLSLCPMGLPLDGRDEAASHRNTHTFNRQANRQARAHKLVHVFAHTLTEASLFFHASQNLGPQSR